MKKIISLIIISLFITSCSGVKESQEEKARDASRIMDLKIIERSIHLYFNDNAVYPKSLEDKNFLEYIPNGLPIDPKQGEIINGCTMGYKYELLDDRDGLKYSNFRLSTCFENKTNTETKAINTNDGGIYEDRFEVGTF